MKKLLLSAVSATAIIVSANVYADTDNTERTMNQNDAPKVTSEDVKEGWKDTKEAVSETAKDVSDATKEAYEDIKAAILEGDDVAKTNTIKIDTNMKTSSMIGAPVLNSKNERVAKVNDIVFGKDGDASYVILGDGDYTGWGKEVAYGYSMIVKHGPNGEIFAPLTEEMIDQAADFSYEKADSGTDVKTIPQGGYSLKEVLDTNISNPSNETMANIEDVVIDNGELKYFIIGYNKTMGLGGERALMNYDDVDVVQKDGKTSFQLSAKKSAQFEVFKNASVQPASN